MSNTMQVIGPDQGDAYLKMKLKDQNKAMQILQESPALQGLTQIQAPYVDLEVRGLPALQYFGDLVWQDAFKDQKGIAQLDILYDCWRSISSTIPPPNYTCLAILRYCIYVLLLYLLCCWYLLCCIPL